MNSSPNILVCIPLPYSRAGDFWGRDAGLLVRGFRQCGHQSILIALQGPEKIEEPTHHEQQGLRLASRAELESKEFWQGMSPEAVVLFAWTLPRYERIRKAVLKVTPNLVERMDTDGMRSPFLGFRRFFYLSWAQAMDKFGATSPFSWKSVPSSIVACFWMLRSVLGAPWFGAHSARVASNIPLILVESPVALERIKRWLMLFHRTGDNVILCPHSVDSVGNLNRQRKERLKRVIAVGRWKSFQKNFELCRKVALSFLEERQDYEFHFIGELPKKIPEAERLIFHGRIPRADILRIFHSSRIVFASSRYESFHLSAAEALCCGCSVVMNKNIPTADWFTQEESGVITSGSAADQVKSLLNEAKAWDNGMRNPEQISDRWTRTLQPTMAAQLILRSLQQNL